MWCHGGQLIGDSMVERLAGGPGGALVPCCTWPSGWSRGVCLKGFRLTFEPPHSPTGRQMQLGQDLTDLLSSSAQVRE